MKAHAITVLVIDHENYGIEEHVQSINNQDALHVMFSRTEEIGPWTDDHPLNKRDTMLKEFMRLFPELNAKNAEGSPEGEEIGKGNDVRTNSDPSASRVYSTEEVLILKVGQLMLHRGFVESAISSLINGRRTASQYQDLVLRSDLDEVIRRCDEMVSVEWPKTVEPEEGSREVVGNVNQPVAVTAETELSESAKEKQRIACILISELRAELNFFREREQKLVEALTTISNYDKHSPFGEGLCHYGCDTPSIARAALSPQPTPVIKENSITAQPTHEGTKT